MRTVFISYKPRRCTRLSLGVCAVRACVRACSLASICGVSPDVRTYRI